MTGVDGARLMAVSVHVGDDPERAAGLVVLVDPTAGVVRVRLWRGRVIEVAPGLIAGIDRDSTTIWIVVDERA